MLYHQLSGELAFGILEEYQLPRLQYFFEVVEVFEFDVAFLVFKLLYCSCRGVKLDV